MTAVRAGNYEVVRNMLSDGEPANQVDRHGETALFEASCRGHTDIVALLLLCHANPNLRSKNNQTVFQVALDEPTRVLLQKWYHDVERKNIDKKKAAVEDFEPSQRDVCSALRRVKEKDRPKLLAKLDLKKTPVIEVERLIEEA